MNLDSYNLVVGRKEDPGDSCHRTCMWYLGLLWTSQTFNLLRLVRSLEKLEIRFSGNYRRHPSRGWWSDEDRFSRDQATPLVILLFEIKNFSAAFRILCLLVSRGLFFTNTRHNGATLFNHGKLKNPEGDKRYGYYDYSWKVPDFCGPEFLALFIRGYRLWFLYPLLLLFDIETLISAIRHRTNMRDNDVLNHLIVTEYTSRVMPTPFSYLSKKLNRKENHGVKLFRYFNRVGLLEMQKLWSEII